MCIRSGPGGFISCRRLADTKGEMAQSYWRTARFNDFVLWRSNRKLWNPLFCFRPLVFGRKLKISSSVDPGDTSPPAAPNSHSRKRQMLEARYQHGPVQIDMGRGWTDHR